MDNLAFYGFFMLLCSHDQFLNYLKWLKQKPRKIFLWISQIYFYVISHIIFLNITQIYFMIITQIYFMDISQIYFMRFWKQNFKKLIINFSIIFWTEYQKIQSIFIFITCPLQCQIIVNYKFFDSTKWTLKF